MITSVNNSIIIIGSPSINSATILIEFIIIIFDNCNSPINDGNSNATSVLI